MRRTRSAIVPSIFRAIPGLDVIRLCMSRPSTATSAVGSSASAVAERVSPRNRASSPNMAPVRSSASATVRPSGCSRRMLTEPLRTT